MENSAFESILIGVSVFIFIIALTYSVHLLVTVLDMSDVANNIMRNEDKSMVKVDTDTERVIYANDILTYKNDESMLEQCIIEVNGSDISNFITSDISVRYTMSYGGIDASGKIIYNLTQI